jgi:hypothetical protein
LLESSTSNTAATEEISFTTVCEGENTGTVEGKVFVVSVVVVRSGLGPRFFITMVVPETTGIQSDPATVGVDPSVVAQTVPAGEAATVTDTKGCQEVRVVEDTVLAVKVPLKACTAIIHIQ